MRWSDHCRPGPFRGTSGSGTAPYPSVPARSPAPLSRQNGSPSACSSDLQTCLSYAGSDVLSQTWQRLRIWPRPVRAVISRPRRIAVTLRITPGIGACSFLPQRLRLQESQCLSKGYGLCFTNRARHDATGKHTTRLRRCRRFARSTGRLTCPSQHPPSMGWEVVRGVGAAQEQTSTQ